MAGDSAFPFDVKFSINGGDTIGFMLATPQGQTKQVEFIEAQGTDSQRLGTQDIATSQDFDPRIDTPYSMSNFTGGVGQLEYDFQDETGYWWSSGVVTHVSGKVYLAPPATTLTLTGTTGAITGITTYLTSANARYDFLWEGANLWRRDAANQSNAWTKVYTASATIYNVTIINGAGFITVPGLSSATVDFLYQSDVTAAATWTPTEANHAAFSDALGKPAYLKAIRSTTYAAVGTTGNNKVFYSVDPTTDAWLGPIDTTLEGNISGAPGDDSYPFTGVAAVGDFLFLMKKDAIYSIDSQQDVYETIWQWKDKPSEYNFKYYATGGDLLLFSVGPEIYQYDPQTGITASLRLSKKDGFSVKEILGLAADNQYVYIMARVRVPTIRSADSVVVMRGIRQRGSAWTFENIWEDTSLTNKTYGVLSAVPFGVGTRLYWGQNNASDTLTYVMDIPAEWDETANASYATTGSLYTSISRAGFHGFEKRHLYMNVNATGVTGQDYVTTYFSVDDGATWTAVGATSANKTEFDFTNIYGSSIVFRFDFTGRASASAVLKNFDHHQRIRFKYLPSVKLTIRIASGINLRNGAKSNLRVDEIWDDVIELRTTTSEITYTDFLGNSFPCTVDMVGVRPTLHEGITDYEEEAVILITRADRGE